MAQLLEVVSETEISPLPGAQGYSFFVFFVLWLVGSGHSIGIYRLSQSGFLKKKKSWSLFNIFAQMFILDIRWCWFHFFFFF